MKRMILFAALASAVWMARAESVRFVTAELPPYTFQVPPATVSEEPGPGQGLVHEAVVEMTRRLREPIAIEYMDWDSAQKLALSQPNIGILSITRTPEREEHYQWCCRIVTDDLILVGGQGIDVSNLEKIRDRPIGVLFHSGAEALVRSLGFTRVQAAPEEWLNATKMKERRIDAWLAPRLMVIHAYKEIGADASTLNFGQIVRPSEIYLAFSKGTPEAEVARWAGAMKAIEGDGTLDQILARYSRLKVEPIPDDRRRFTRGSILWNN
ncbi:MAG TPA: transporter substrate-binding domain-containing protein [Burkholderiaceae bacterium]|jgi:polar amino acid transport system substrate-binding protein|nr:transporter substrate-binding domain-containing protein [Burkholderiaceae bacterium]